MFPPSQIREIARRQRQRGVEVVQVTAGPHSLRIRVAAGAAAPATATAPAAAALLTVRSETLGIALLSSSPDLQAPRCGDAVVAGQLLAFVELGEQRHAVRAPAAGVLAAVRVEAGQAVDYGMPLFELTPTEGAAA